MRHHAEESPENIALISQLAFHHSYAFTDTSWTDTVTLEMFTGNELLFP